MQITDVRIRKIFNDDAPMKAIASVIFDDQLALHDIKVIGIRERLLVVMPSRKNMDNTYRDVAHPINAEFRAVLEKAVLDEYFRVLELMKEENGEFTVPAEEENADKAE